MRAIRPILLSLIILVFSTSHALAQDRAVWVWSMADDIVLDSPAGSRAEFFSFCDAPHGDATKKITIIYLSGQVPGKDLVVNYAQQLRGFLAAAHSRNLKVECLQGDKLWATPEHRSDGEARFDQILNFNKAGPSDSQRFDGIHYDVEPYLLRYDEGDRYDWDADNASIWTQYLLLLDNCQAKVNTYNNSYTDIKFGVAISWWYDTDVYDTRGPNDIQTRVNYVTIMDYRDSGPSIVNGAAGEMENGDTLGKEVFVGVETAQAVPPDPPTITFYEEGNDAMEQALAYAGSIFNANTSFGGFAIHYYEDTNAGEVAYRGLWTTSFPGYHPIVKLTFPNGDEGIDFVPGTTYDITWKTSDRDTKAQDLTIDIDYSSDSGVTWNSLKTGEVNDGIYAWNTTGIPDGTAYRVKVTAKDPGGLSGYDSSDYDITFSSTYSSPDDWSNARNSTINGARPIVIPSGDTLHMVWYWPGWGSTATGVYYRKSIDRGVTWGSTVVLAEDPAGGTVQPRKPAFAARGNNLAVVWVEDVGPPIAPYYGNIGKKVKVKTSSDGGDSWTTVADEVQRSYTSFKWADFPDIGIDSSNNIHVVWGARYTTGNQQWEIHYNYKPSGGGWAGRVTISESTPAHVRATPAITSDPNGIHVVWGEFTWSSWKYKIKYCKKSGSWGTPTQIYLYPGTVPDVEWAKKYFPDICSDSSDNNKLHVVWQYATDNPDTGSAASSVIYYSSSSDKGATWPTPINLANGYVPAVCADDGELRLIYYRPSSTTGKGDIRYTKSTNGGGNWSGEATLTDDAKTPYFFNDLYVETMVGFPSLASGSMVAAWRGYSTDSIMFCYKGEFATPSNLFADLVYGSTNSIKLKWSKPEGYTPNSYRIYRSQDGGAYSQAATNVYDVEYIDTNLSGTSYYKYKVTAVEGGSESGFSNISNVLYPGTNFLIDYFEGFEGINYGKIGTSTLTWSTDTSDKQEGSRSMKLNYTYVGPPTDPTKWGAVLTGTFPTTINISSYDSVRVWVKGGTVGSKGIAVQFSETGRPEGNETWSSISPTISNTGWQMYEFSLNNFERTTELMNNHFDKDSIGGYLLFFSKDTVSGTYWVDRVELYRSQPTITAAPSSVDFGTISGTIANHRFQSPAITVSYSGFGPPWTIRVWTNNSPEGGAEPEKAGLKGVDDPLIYVPLKVWCANYGPTENVPDEENDYFWSGYDFNNDGDKDDIVPKNKVVKEINNTETVPPADLIAIVDFDVNGDGDKNDKIVSTGPTGARVSPTQYRLSEEPYWLRIPEKDEMDPNNVYTWRRLSWNDGLGDDAGLGGDFNIYLAVDTTDVAKLQEYRTTLMVEYINQ